MGVAQNLQAKFYIHQLQNFDSLIGAKVGQPFQVLDYWDIKFSHITEGKWYNEITARITHQFGDTSILLNGTFDC